MLYTDSCRGCKDRIEIIIADKFIRAYAYKMNGCRRITDRLYKPVLAHRSLRDAVESLSGDYENQGYIVPDQFEKSSPETLFPEIIETGMWIECLPVEERHAEY